ncbi:chemotaxis protein CheA [Lysobacter sp. TY2-98]|uniref:chemotaxis protein CheA n=1 Tax=Lysobacter sp. TY2-98 TaxID=2290922 RepID=UPI000E203850|nr:chemotaxis protein CheA [Lysobacter sp. TY2-98]AXK71165.1 chemotaxis protein CheA [Lysobacter sp. TY2-98]
MDMSRFHAAFFEESREGLDIAESGLLGMESGRSDADTINAIFRAAHSIKGGAGTFGFKYISDFTHVMETLLDEARAGKRHLDSAAVSVLLTSVDVLRGMLQYAESGGALDQPAIDASKRELDTLLTGVAPPMPTAAAAKPKSDGPECWRIHFRPFESLFMSGNDPLRMLRELADLGARDIVCLEDTLPKFGAFDPVNAYLGWSFELPGTVKRAAIDDVFAWVEDQCDLVIEAVEPEVADVDVAPVAVETAASNDAHAPTASGGGAESSIRVAVTKVDALINLVGEIVITQAMLQQRAEGLDPVQFEGLLAAINQLERNSRDLQEAVMSVRMLPVDFAFSRFPRMVRDLATRLGKKVRLKTVGEQTELDKGVIEKIVDPLVHLIRNSIDHGLESPEDRRAAGKDETGTISLTARHQGGHIVIEVTDDGRGLNRDKILAKAIERNLPLAENPTDAQVWELIFHPGFSTADKLTDVSGRGVGMDVVRKNIQALGGSVDIRSVTGKGSTMTIRLPLTLAILDGMTVAVGSEVFVLPLNVVIESLQPKDDEVRTIGGGDRVLRLRDDYIPMVNLSEQYGFGPGTCAMLDTPSIAVVVESEGKRIALEVDELIGQQQVVIKNLESNYRKVAGVSGATILGDGRVALIVDADGLAQHIRMKDAA